MMNGGQASDKIVPQGRQTQQDPSSRIIFGENLNSPLNGIEVTGEFG